MENQIKQIESFFSRLKRRPVKTASYVIVGVILIIIVWFFSAYFGEIGRQLASNEQLALNEARPDSELFETGWTTYHRFRLNKENPAPFEIGNCPGTGCYRFRLGPRKIEDGRQSQTIYLEGIGFEKHLERLSEGVISLFRNARLDCKGGSYGLPSKGGPMTANLGLFKGASLRLRAIDQDVLFVVEDDRINYLTVGVAIYDGTYCELYRKGLLPPGKIPECEE